MLAFDDVSDADRGTLDLRAGPGGPLPQPDPRRLFGRWYLPTFRGSAYDNDHWRAFFGRVADNLVNQLQPHSVLDAGCAKGLLVAALRERGVEADGFDLSDLVIANAVDEARPYVRVASLTEPIGGRYDLVTCIEVMEHLDPADAATAVANLCAVSDRVLLSSTPSDTQDANRVNVRPLERWSQLFAAHGFYRDFRHDAAYLTPWAVLYRRETRSVSEVVLEYDREWAQLRAETIAQRRALLDLQERIAELDPTGAGGRHPLDDQNELLRKEIMRLRDALIGKEAELGTMLGKTAEIHAMARHLESMITGRDEAAVAATAELQRVLSSRSWRIIWSAGWPVRALRSRKAR